jgi:hypothetical protein
MKISVQEKIAELEARIVKLEAASKSRNVEVTRINEAMDGVEWKTMWASFDKFMARIFK